MSIQEYEYQKFEFSRILKNEKDLKRQQEISSENKSQEIMQKSALNQNTKNSLFKIGSKVKENVLKKFNMFRNAA